MLSLTNSATLVALIQTAAGLPVVLLAVPAGAIGDLADRRRLLIASQSLMLLAASVPIPRPQPVIGGPAPTFDAAAISPRSAFSAAT
jgi:MFS family permease